MMIYLDNCCFNRPFDDQQQLRIRLEAEAKLRIQEVVRAGDLELAWSYILDFENENNPFLDRRERIQQWRSYAKTDCVEDLAVKRMAESLRQKGLRQIDSLHVACAIHAGCDYFITTDDRILSKSETISEVVIDDPIGFIKKELP